MATTDTAARTTTSSNVALSPLIDAFPDAACAAVCLATWFAGASPAFLGQLTLGLLLEFLVIHGAFLLARRLTAAGRSSGKVFDTAVLLLLQTLVVASLCLVFWTWWPLVAFWLLSSNRLIGPLLRARDPAAERSSLRSAWAAGLIAWLGAAIVTSSLPLPRLGLTGALRDDAGLRLTGTWLDEPHRAAAFGALYFGVMAISKLIEHRWVSLGRAPTD